ncbi:TPA: phage head-tail connector protein [Staphylococcus pseudintermedius]|nr:phage head-tail adapter protein [Staphylococcus pseudintermedius]HAR6087717.1 phage head-tail connector protein [Staphylococcus pseudintermedius]HAR6178438.1 phage head-tail connector protein [Staphylococcus pseudintermedius]HAR6215668.1 phage head-tail connector protein [Staphylococcus pseudintermedius]HAR6218027.1 phage head-tail connector protein [Staphylococcus pseudintermedius]
MKTFLDKVKKRIGIEDHLQDKLLNEIVTNVVDELKLRLPKEQAFIPQPLYFIVIEVAVKRYNKVGSEGMVSESVEGRSMSYEEDDFKQYDGFINKFFDDGCGEVLFF